MDTYELNETSNRINHLDNLNINLKDHQLAIIKKCEDIEIMNICNIGIMSDKPGTGKTYAILGYILYNKLKYNINYTNIIIVPQNIIIQWTNSINMFSNGLLSYKRLTEYSDILNLYYDVNTLSKYDIIITTSLYYNMISTTLKSNKIKINRIFFDEIDSISSFLTTELDTDFAWFISASFTYDKMGIYKNRIEKDLLTYITCKCNNTFIDNCMNLPPYNIYKIICKNKYLDSIFNGMLSKDEYKVLNAMDFSKLKKKYCNQIARNEKEALDYLVKDMLEIIDTEKLRIEDLTKQINCKNDYDDEKITKILKEQLQKSTEILEQNEYKLNLLRNRLTEFNYCQLCYGEFDGIKMLSKCCKNIVCSQCTNNWFEVMKKTNCIWCNTTNIKIEDYVIIKEDNKDNICRLCNHIYNNENDKYSAECCKIDSCINCIKEWYQKLLQHKCMHCNKEDIIFEDFMNEEMRLNIKMTNNTKTTNKTKMEYMDYFIRTKISENAKVIICSSYIQIFNDIKNMLQGYNINYKELDDGNIDSIYSSINEYTNGNTNVLLMNSNLFGCGLNLQCTNDIIFLHKTEPDLEKQIIGRAQRKGRTNNLNVWYLLHKNELINSI